MELGTKRILIRMTTRVAIVVAFFMFVTAAAAQTGRVTGRVSDSSGIPLPGVTVTVDGPGIQGSAITDADGNFDVQGFPPTGSATYRIDARLAGFRDATVSV